MTHTLLIETQSESDFALLKGLAQRLGLPTDERHTASERLLSAQESLFYNLFGSWQGPESGDELANLIQSARHDRPFEPTQSA